MQIYTKFLTTQEINRTSDEGTGFTHNRNTHDTCFVHRRLLYDMKAGRRKEMSVG